MSCWLFLISPLICVTLAKRKASVANFLPTLFQATFQKSLVLGKLPFKGLLNVLFPRHCQLCNASCFEASDKMTVFGHRDVTTMCCFLGSTISCLCILLVLTSTFTALTSPWTNICLSLPWNLVYLGVCKLLPPLPCA